MKARRIGAIFLASLGLTSGAFAAKAPPLYLSTTNLFASHKKSSIFSIKANFEQVLTPKASR